MLGIHDQIVLEFKKIIKKELFDEWLNSPNAELDFKTPQEMLNKRNYQPLWNMIFSIARLEGIWLSTQKQVKT